MTKIHIGTMGWSYSFWIGKLYTAGCKPEEYLSEYSKHFDTVEVDSTFYRIPYKSTVAKWKTQTQPEFIFSAKFPKAITHDKRLVDCEEELKRFLESISPLQEKTGPLLLQFPPSFKSTNIPALKEFLEKMPHGHRLAVEVRNRELLSSELNSLLRDNRVTLVFTDHSSTQEMEEVTGDFVYVRCEGDRKKVQGTSGKVEVEKIDDVKNWADRIKRYADKSMEVFVYFSKYYTGYPPSDAEQLKKALKLTVNLK
ncbi:MAG: hypothetical protein QG670_556 [Thermoproteota archaeon]|nr:hypothetical protein [Thermoproteota archaeon]